MRNLVLLLMPLVLLGATEKPQRSKKPAAASVKSAAGPAKAAAAATAPVSIPAGAVEIEPYLFRHTAADGKVWLYRKTPFGITKMEEKVREAALRAKNMLVEQKVQVTDKGETIRFERATPMGNQAWEKKRAELTAEEKGWLEKNADGLARPEK